ncbi:MAG: hypothetical protein WAX07_04410 [Candidatus Altiarchaeia archaeon]
MLNGPAGDGLSFDLLTFGIVAGTPGSIQVADVVIKNDLEYNTDAYLFSKNDQDVVAA